MINITLCRASEAIHACALVPQLSGLTIEVPAGTVTFGGVTYSLAEDEEFIVTPGHEIDGWLVVDEGDDLHLFVYPWPLDGSGISFEPSNYPTLKFLHNLFIAKVPVGTTDLSDVEFQLFHIVKPEGDS